MTEPLVEHYREQATALEQWFDSRGIQSIDAGVICAYYIALSLKKEERDGNLNSTKEEALQAFVHMVLTSMKLPDPDYRQIN